MSREYKHCNGSKRNKSGIRASNGFKWSDDQCFPSPFPPASLSSDFITFVPIVVMRASQKKGGRPP